MAVIGNVPGTADVARVGLGCMGLTGAYGAVTPDAARETVHRALELGVRMFDTADFYGQGENERMVGALVGSHRDEVLIATKVGLRLGATGFEIDGSSEYLRRACEVSLARLGTDRIDLLYLSRVDPRVDIEESVGGLAELVNDGMVRAIGLSEASATTIRRAHQVHPISAVQTEYSIWERGVEQRILPTLRELGIGLVAYSPLGRGVLAGGITTSAEFSPGDLRRTSPRCVGDNLQENLHLVATIRDVAAATDSTPAQVSLAWVLARDENVTAIPGTSNPKHVEANVEAASLTLPQDAMARIDDAFLRGVSGARYIDPLLAAIDVDEATLPE